MKRMNALKFSLLGATALALVACGKAEEDVLAYDSVKACVKAGQQDESVCKAEFAKAQKLHNEVAHLPRPRRPGRFSPCKTG